MVNENACVPVYVSVSVCGNADNKAANVPDAQVCVEVCVCVCGNRSALIHI